MRLKVIPIMMVFLLILTSTFHWANVSSDVAIYSSTVSNNTRKTSHSIINISSNSDMISQANLEGWQGNGTTDDPYIITNMTIYGNDCFACIWISNLSLQLIIDDCLIYGSSPINGSGIRIENSSNIKIQNCFSNNNIYGISIIDSEYIVVIDNLLRRNDEGIILIRSEYCDINNNNFTTNFNNGMYLVLSNYLMIDNNQIYDNNIGINLLFSESNRILNNNIFRNSFLYVKLEESKKNLLRNNTCEESSWGMEITTNSNNNVIEYNKFYGYAHDSITIKDSIQNSLFSNNIVNSSIRLIGVIETYYYQIIPENNTVNNKPILYLTNRNMDWEVIDNNYGQIILVGIENLLMNNQSFYGGSIGMLLSFSSNITIFECHFSNMNRNSIYSYNSNNIKIDSSTFDDNQAAIYVQECVNISITNNIFKNDMCSILSMTSSLINIRNNTIMNADIGIELTDRTNFVTLEDNIFNDTRSVSIRLFQANNIIIQNNTIDSGYYGIDNSGTRNVFIEGNIISNANRCIDEGITNATIINNQFINFIDYGIRVTDSNYIITNNLYQSISGYSIIFSHSNNHIIMDNQFLGTEGFAGILVSSSIGNIFRNNRLYNCSFSFFLQDGEYSKQVIIDNFIDDKPILYLKDNNHIDNISNKEYGQVIISNCNDIILNKLSVSSYRYGIIVVNSNNISLINSSVQSTGTSIKLLNSNGCIIRENTFNGTDNALAIENGKLNSISDCLFYNISNGVFSHISSRGFSVTNNAFIYSPCFSEGINTHFEAYLNDSTFKGNYWNDHISNYDLISGVMEDPYCIKDSYFEYERIYDLYPLAYIPKEIIAPPFNVVAQTPENRIFLSWEGPGANEYVIYRSHWGEPYTDIIHKEGPNNLSHVFFSDNTNINYTYRVQGIWDIGPSYLSESKTVVRYNPKLEILSPTNGEYLNKNNIEVRWTHNFAPTSIISICIDGREEICVGTSSSYNITNLSQGEHTITVTINTEQNKSDSKIIRFTVDSEDPWIEVYQPGWDEYFNLRNVTVQYSFDDGINSLLNHYYRLNNNGWFNISNTGTIHFLDLEDGEYMLEVKINDEAGNEKVDGTKFIVDTVSPFIVDYGPKDGILNVNEYMFFTISESTINYDTSIVKINGEHPSNISHINSTFYIPYEKFIEKPNHTVQIILIDLAGNEMETFSFSFYVEGVKYPYLVIGRIVDENQQPIVGAMVTIYSNNEFIDMNASRSDGTFTFRLYSNNYTIEALLFDHPTSKLNFTVDYSDLNLGDIVIYNYDDNNKMYPPGNPSVIIIFVFLFAIVIILLVLVARSRYLHYHDEREE